MHYIKTLIIVLPLLILLTRCTSAQETVRIPLKQGGCNSNPSFQIEDLTIKPTYFIWSESSNGEDLYAKLELELKISTPSDDHTTLLCYYQASDSQSHNGISKAFGKFLFDLDIRQDGVDLLIRQLKFGDEFIVDLEPKLSYIVENLTIRYDSGFTANIINVDNSYGGYEIMYSLIVSDGESEERLSFDYIHYAEEDNATKNCCKEWKNYRIEILDDFFPPKLRVTKI